MAADPAEVEQLQKRVSELEQENRELKARVAALESHLQSLGHDPGETPSVH